MQRKNFLAALNYQSNQNYDSHDKFELTVIKLKLELTQQFFFLQQFLFLYFNFHFSSPFPLSTMIFSPLLQKYIKFSSLFDILSQIFHHKIYTDSLSLQLIYGQDSIFPFFDNFRTSYLSSSSERYLWFHFRVVFFIYTNVFDFI